MFDPLVKAAILKKLGSGDASAVVPRDISAVYQAEYQQWAATCQSGIFPSKVSAGAIRFKATAFSCMALAIAHVRHLKM